VVETDSINAGSVFLASDTFSVFMQSPFCTEIVAQVTWRVKVYSGGYCEGTVQIIIS